MSNERRAGKTVVIIVCISFFVGLPLLVYFGMVLHGQRDPVYLAKAYIIVMMMSMLNAVLKPLVYCYRTALLRKYAKKLFGVQEGLARSNGVSMSTVRTFSTQCSAGSI